MQSINATLVSRISGLANIPITHAEEEKLAFGFTKTLGVIDQLMDVDTTDVSPTHQVTGLENVLREDGVDEPRMFSQEEALANAAKTHDGYFVVPQVISGQ